MWVFIQKASVFTLFLFVLNFLLFEFADKHYYSQYNNIPSKSYHTFLFADSHGAPLKKSTEAFGIFNYSIGSDSYFDMHRKIQYLSNQSYQIDTVYISIDDHTLSTYRDNANNKDRSVYFVSLFNSVINSTESLQDKLVYYIPLLQPKVAALLKTYTKAKIQKSNTSQEHGNWGNVSKAERVRQAKLRMTTQFPDEEPSETQTAALKNIISFCNQRNITLIGLKFPLTDEYRNMTREKSFGAEAIFQSNGLLTLDYTNVFHGKSHLFVNQDHLNPKGGEIFSSIIFTKQ